MVSRMMFPSVQDAYLNIDYNNRSNSFACTLAIESTNVNLTSTIPNANRNIALINQTFIQITQALIAIPANQINLTLQTTATNRIISDATKIIGKEKIDEELYSIRSDLYNQFRTNTCQII